MTPPNVPRIRPQLPPKQKRAEARAVRLDCPVGRGRATTPLSLCPPIPGVCVTADQLGAFVPILLIVLAFWFLIIRPARKRQTQARQLQSQIAVGERVMLTSGIFGQVVGMDDETLELEIAPGVVITTLRPAVARVVEPTTEGADEVDGADGAEEADSERTRSERTDGKDSPA